MLAGREAILSEVALSMVTVSLPIKKRQKKDQRVTPLALLPYIDCLRLLR